MSSNGNKPQNPPLAGVRLEEMIAATGLDYTRFSLALAGLPYGGSMPRKGSTRWKRYESKRRQLRRWRSGESGLENATAVTLVEATNRVLAEMGSRERFPLEYLVDAEQPKATLERLDMKLDLLLLSLEEIKGRMG